MPRFGRYILAAAFALSLTQTARGQLSPTYGRRPNPVERDTRYRDWVLDSLRKTKGAAPSEEELRTRNHGDVSVGLLLSALDGLIVRFVKNPSFKESAVVDSAAAPRARRDLLLIIRLSKHLAGRAKALSNAGN